MRGHAVRAGVLVRELEIGDARWLRRHRQSQHELEREGFHSDGHRHGIGRSFVSSFAVDEVSRVRISTPIVYPPNPVRSFGYRTKGREILMSRRFVLTALVLLCLTAPLARP